MGYVFCVILGSCLGFAVFSFCFVCRKADEIEEAEALKLSREHDKKLLQDYSQWLWDRNFLVDEAFTLRLVDMYREENNK